MSYDQFTMFCFANSINPEYKFIQKYKDGTIKLFKKRDVDPGIVLDTSFFNPVIFECIPINKICSIHQVVLGYKLGSGERLGYISSSIHYDYPYNLLEAICPANSTEYLQLFNMSIDQFILQRDMTDDILKGLDYAISTLTSREQKVVTRYFKIGNTLATIGLEFGVTGETIRAILAKAIRKLRHPSRFKYILYGYEIASGSTTEQMKALRQHEIDAANKELDSKIEAIKKRAAEPLANVSIHELDLSTRSYNCLYRAGIETLADLSKMTINDLIKVRNLGKRSATEIIEKLKEYGITLKEEV